MCPAKTTPATLPRINRGQVAYLKRLSEACSVSGDEGEVRALVLDAIRSHSEQIRVDALGNILVTVPGRGGDRLRVMVAAHMDEVGFMLTHDDGEGLFRFEAVGGVDERQLAGKPVWVGREHVPGMIGAKPIHLTTADERQQALQIDSLRIDVGPAAGSRVRPGDRATFATHFTRLGPSLRGKALDNRLGVATLIQLVRHAPSNIDLLAAFTVQEEIGLRGAGVAAYDLNPDLAIVLDCTPAYDLPAWDAEENVRYNTRLGAGPAIYLADAGTLSDPRLVGHLVKTAEDLGIPYQFRQPSARGATDAAAIHRQRAGIPSISVSVPGRYAHSAASVARLSDWRHTLSLVHASLARLQPKLISNPGYPMRRNR